MTGGRRVLVVGGASVMSGGEVGLIRLLPPLAAEGWHCQTALIEPSDGAMAEALTRAGHPPEVFRVPRIRNVIAGTRAIAGLARLARGVDVLHANDIRGALYCQAAALLSRRPWTFHARDLYGAGGGFQRALRRLRPARVVAVSRATATTVERALRWPSDRIDVVYAGLDADDFADGADGAAWRGSVALEPSHVAIGIVGRLVEWKGQGEFLHAAADVARSHPDARFFIVGGELVGDGEEWGLGEEARRLRDLADSLGIGAQVVLTGPREQITDVMAGLDVLVLASSAEPFGLVLLEAMAHGTAVVATDAGGAPEIVVDGLTGRLVPPRAPVALARAISELVRDPDLRRRLGEAGRERLSASFRPESEASGVAATWARAARA